jgi:tRNA1(Val) A37 N6-methylase TrmN6
LTDAQRQQIARQIEYHSGGPYCHVLDTSAGLEVTVEPNVMRPMSSVALSQWIANNPWSVSGRVVIDIGTGCGIQAFEAARAGADRVIASDISDEACRCTTQNVERLDLASRIEVRVSDLFEAYQSSEVSDVIVFAQPLFGDDPLPEIPVTVGMLDSGQLIARFLAAAGRHLSMRGLILMVGWDFAGTVNDPRGYASSTGWAADVVGRTAVNGPCQVGDIEVIRLIRKRTY